MTEYKNSKIYKITDANNEMVYIGSTTMPLNWRMSCHKSNYNKHKRNYTVYKIFEKYGIDKCSIQLIENYPCENRKQLEKREGEIMKSMPCVNKCIAGKNRIENIKEYNRLYHIENKERKKLLYQLKKLSKVNNNLEQQQLNESLAIIDNTPDTPLIIDCGYVIY